MKCLFLEGGQGRNCIAVQQTYMPSPFELREYCRTNRHKVCPLYLGFIRQPCELEIPASNSERKSKAL